MNVFFFLFMVLGNILGFVMGVYDGWYKIFVFMYIKVCDIVCVNFKFVFLLGVIFLFFIIFLSVIVVSEVLYDFKNVIKGIVMKFVR